MIIINLKDGYLDLYEDETIQWKWTTFRFSGKLQDSYTNDFSIPKTPNNQRLLNIYSVLDASSQRVKKENIPALLQEGDNAIRIFIEVQGISKDEIKICLYENSFFSKFKDVNLSDYFTDDQNTIYEWISNSPAENPTVFLPYNYGAPYKYIKAQYHPSKKLNDILQDIAIQENINIDLIPDNYRLLASKKNVCPQNKTQAIEMDLRYMSNNYYDLYGGQHIVNDCSQDTLDHLTFNRDVDAKMTVYCIWRKKVGTTQNKQIDIRKNGQLISAIFINSSQKREGTAIQYSLQTKFKAGDTFSLYFPDADRFQCCSVVLKMEYNNYEITKDDYNTDLQYSSRRPGLDYYDGTTHTRYPMNGRQIQIGTDTLIPPLLSFSYFGFWTNTPNIKIGSLFYDLQWQLGKKIFYDIDTIYFSDQPVSEEVKGEILEIYTNSSYVGQNNYIIYKGEEYKEEIPVSTIDNEWLVLDKNLYESPYEYLPNNVVQQYKISEDGKYTFNELQNPVLLYVDNNNQILHTLQHLNLEELTQSNEVKIQLYNAIPLIDRADVIYMDGRKYFVIEGTKNFKNNDVNITAIPAY